MARMLLMVMCVAMGAIDARADHRHFGVVITGNYLEDSVPTVGKPGFRTYTLKADTVDLPIAGLDFYGYEESLRGFFGPLGQVAGGPIPAGGTVFNNQNDFFSFIGADVSQDSQFKFKTSGPQGVLVPTGFASESETYLRAAFALATPLSSVAFAQLSIPEGAIVEYRGEFGTYAIPHTGSGFVQGTVGRSRFVPEPAAIALVGMAILLLGPLRLRSATAAEIAKAEERSGCRQRK